VGRILRKNIGIAALLIVGFVTTSFGEDRCFEAFPVNPAHLELHHHDPSFHINFETQSLYQKLLAARQPLPAISIVIPAYKEERRIPKSLEILQQFQSLFPLQLEVLVMVEKSPDRTVEVATQAAANSPWIRVVDNQVQRGKGYAVRSGMMIAGGEIVFFMDADLSTSLTEILRFLEAFQRQPNVDVMIGSRKEETSNEDQGRSWVRRAMSATFTATTRPLVGNIKDTQAGFKAFRRHTIQPIFSQQTIDGFAFDIEVLALAEGLGYDVEARAIHWLDAKGSTLNPFWDPLKMLMEVAKIRNSVHRRLARLQPAE
jgi:dolichyl-phosphate beta-glucosyltransferase